MGADKSKENTPNASKFICSNCLPKPNRLGYLWKKASLGVHGPCFHPYYWFMFLFKNRIKKQTPEQITLHLFTHKPRVELNLEIEFWLFRQCRQFGQINIRGIFRRFIGSHLGTMSPLSISSINQSLFLQKTKPLYPNGFWCDCKNVPAFYYFVKIY